MGRGVRSFMMKYMNDGFVCGATHLGGAGQVRCLLVNSVVLFFAMTSVIAALCGLWLLVTKKRARTIVLAGYAVFIVISLIWMSLLPFLG